jgi:hypothetical protein
MGRTDSIIIVSAILLAGTAIGALATLYFGKEGNVLATRSTQESTLIK